MINKLKNQLLNLGFVVDNEYLTKYCELIVSNLNRNSVKHQTQSHHVVPVFYYKHQHKGLTSKQARVIADEDSQNIKVNLLYFEHILAHWFLYKSIIDDTYFKYVSVYSLFYMLNSKTLPEHEQDIIQQAINYGEVYSNFCVQQSIKFRGKPGKTKGIKATEETRKKLSLSHMGQKQSQEAKLKKSMSLKKAYEEGRKSRERTQEQREKISNTIRGSKVMNNGQCDKVVKSHDIERYLNDGWVFGYLDTYERRQQYQLAADKQRETNKNRIIVRMTNGIDNRVAHSIEEKLMYEELGYWNGLTKSKSIRTKPAPKYVLMTDMSKNYHAYNQQQIDEYLSMGLVMGTYKQNLKKQQKDVVKQRKNPYWTEDDDALLRQLFNQGLSVEEISQYFKSRKQSAVKNRMYLLGLGNKYKHFRGKFICIDTGKVYNNLKDASTELNIDRQYILNVLRGVQKTSGGYTFKVIEEEK